MTARTVRTIAVVDAPKPLESLTVEEAIALAVDIDLPTGEIRRPRAFLTVDTDYSFRVYFGLDLGRKPSAPVGPAFAHSRDAGRLADALNVSFTESIAVGKKTPVLNTDGSVIDHDDRSRITRLVDAVNEDLAA